jgi:hypothetical protein
MDVSTRIKVNFSTDMIDRDAADIHAFSLE